MHRCFMKSAIATAFMLGFFISSSSLAQQMPVEDLTPAQQRIADARQQLQADPQKLQATNELAIALMRRARETADAGYLKEADATLAQALKRDAHDFALLRTKAALLVSEHEFAKAKELATALHSRTPDDVLTYGHLADAEIGLGEYAEAEKNVQWMMNLRPNNTPALMVGAKLRVLFGDGHGAIQFLNRAYAQTSPTEVEDLAWIMNQIAAIQIASGQNDAAAQTLAQAEQLFPGYPYAIENMARVRMGQSRPADAVALWKQAAKADGNPHVLYELARGEEAAGKPTEARATYTEFEKLACDPATATDDARLDLVRMYAGNPATAAKALQLAELEMKARQDVATLDAYGWALYANGKFQDADAAEQKAMAVGVQSAEIFDHAGRIAQKLNHADDAAKDFALAMQANPGSEFALDARKSLGGANLVAVAPTSAANPAAAEVVRADSTVIAADVPRPNVAAVFVPVPENLLTPRPTSSEQLLHSAQAAVARSPKDAAAYAGLGAAYFQRARETGDVSDYDLAEQSLKKALDVSSDDFASEAALETLAEVCMGEHRFTDALTYAQKALSLGTGELSPFAIVGDAHADMGDYDKAAVAYGRLTPRDMTLSARAAYARDSRVAYLKFVSGDTSGAIALMKTAVAEGTEAQLPGENLAWLNYELGEFESQAGDQSEADAAYLAALNIHPGDYRALAGLGKLRANAGRYQEAIVLYQKAIAIVPMPIFVAELGDLYAKQGNTTEAHKQFALVEYIGLLGKINQVLHNRDLAIFYADHDTKLAEGLELARKELEVRRDVYTWDALAWALYKNGKLNEAAEASHKALQFGTRDALLLFHAGMIAEAQGQPALARTELKEALKINPHFHTIYAEAAEQELAALETLSKSKEGSDNHGR